MKKNIIIFLFSIFASIVFSACANSSNIIDKLDTSITTPVTSEFTTTSSYTTPTSTSTITTTTGTSLTSTKKTTTKKKTTTSVKTTPSNTRATTTSPTTTASIKTTKITTTSVGTTTRQTTTTTAHVHNYSSKIIAPDCIHEGYTEYTCKCGNSYVENVVKALGHSYTNWEVKKQTPIRTDYIRKCLTCGVEDTKSKEHYPNGNYTSGLVYGSYITQNQLDACAIFFAEASKNLQYDEEIPTEWLQQAIDYIRKDINVSDDSASNSLYDAVISKDTSNFGYAVALKYLCDACNIENELAAAKKAKSPSDVGVLVKLGKQYYFCSYNSAEPFIEVKTNDYTTDISNLYPYRFLVEPGELIAKACTALGTKYVSGGKGAGGQIINGRFVSIYDGAKPTFFSVAELSTKGAKGIDCSGLVYWALGSMGVTSQGFYQNKMTLAAETWHYYKGNSAITNACFIRNGLKADAIIVRQQLNSKKTHYWVSDDGGTIPIGSICIVKNPSNQRYDHTWIYIGEPDSREAIIDKLVTEFGVDRKLLEKKNNVVDKGNGSTHWRIESAGGSVQQVQINNGEDGLTSEFTGTMAVSIGYVKE